MKFCTHCGAEIADAAVVCVKCGCSLGNNTNQMGGVVSPYDAPSVGFAVLGFFLPLIGAILILIWNKSNPQKAMSCAKGIAISFIVSAVFISISILASFSTIVGLLSSSF